MGQSEALPELITRKDLLISENISEEFVEDEEVDSSSQMLYIASFDELADSYLQYDTIIWFSISVLLVLAWGAGVVMLLYLPFMRYVLRKDISSRNLCVTPTEIVYKVSRPSYIPFWRGAKIERRVPLSLVIDIIIEQGWLQSIYGLHTIRVESISCGKAAPMDELQVQGVTNPGLLRKVIITEASKVVQDSGRAVKLAPYTSESELLARMGSLSEGPAVLRSPSKNLKVTSSPRPTSLVSGDFLLYKIDEVNKSVKRIESIIEKTRVPSSDATE